MAAGQGAGAVGGLLPEAALGPLPHVYPFIVNDPGEGSQAKRRSAAVIVDHLTPPLTRAESYGPLAELERLVDEYYEAAGVDPRRTAYLRGEILALSGRLGLDRDVGIAPDDPSDTALAKLDSHLCELKELQIRDGLHVFGKAPDGAPADRPAGRAGPGAARRRRGRRCVAAAGARGRPRARRLRPAGLRDGGALAGRPARGSAAARTTSPGAAMAIRSSAWSCARARWWPASRSPEPGWHATRAVLEAIADEIRPAVLASGPAESRGVLAALDGRFVEPGPSGAPTRGRSDVLPTGRNFYSVDSRAVPTPAAWHLGWRSAALLIERYVQEQGEWPRAVALSAWGTANMRTGGDDVAQALALIGARPVWDRASHRVTGSEILPLGRARPPAGRRDACGSRASFATPSPPRSSCSTRRCAAIAALDEPPELNPIAARVRADEAALLAGGASPTRRAGGPAIACSARSLGRTAPGCRR